MEILKKLVMNRDNVAKLSHYTAGSLYYTIEIEDGIYQFPVETTEKRKIKVTEEGKDSTSVLFEFEITKLSSDLGTTNFDNEIKAATMMRYIRKAIDNETLVKIG